MRDLPLPPAIGALAAGYSAERVTLGASGTAVFRLSAPGMPTRFLKHGSGDLAQVVLDEAVRLRWLRGRIPAPKVLACEQHGAEVYLLMSAVRGVDATDSSHATDPQRMVRVLAAGLRLIHATPLGDCPFDYRIDAMLASAQRRLDSGMLQPEMFNTWGIGQNPHEVFATLLSLRRPEVEPALTHGDYCLPNVLIEYGELTGFCDLGRLGAGDPYRDLALAARSLRRNWGADYVPLLFAEYGLPQPDEQRLLLYSALDEFF